MSRGGPTSVRCAPKCLKCMCVALALLVATPALAQYDDPPPSPKAEPATAAPERVKQLRAEVVRRRDAINAELRKLVETPAKGDDAWANEWAGEYSWGGAVGLKATILLAPRAGLVYLNDGCFDLTDVNYGTITKADGFGVSLKLASNRSNLLSRFISDEYCFVRRGERRYLIPRSQLETLGQELRKGDDRAEPTWLVRVEDQRKPLGPVSNISDTDRAMIQWPHIEGRVVTVRDLVETKLQDDLSAVSGTAVLDHGALDGVLVGMRVSISGSFPDARVVSVSDHSCEATFFVLKGEYRRRPFRAPKPGDSFHVGDPFDSPIPRPLPTPPIEAQIVEVKDVAIRDFKDGSGKAYVRGTLVIELGRADRIEEGMPFRLRTGDRVMVSRATRVDEHRCEIEFLQRRIEGMDDDLPSKGEWVSTEDTPFIDALPLPRTGH